MDDSTVTYDTHDTRVAAARPHHSAAPRSARVLANPRRSRLAAWPRVQDTLAPRGDED